MITLPLTTAQFVAAVFILMPAVCALVTWTTNRIDTRTQRRKFKAEKAAIARERAELAGEKAAIAAQRWLAAEEVQFAREQQAKLHDQAQQAHATLDSEAENFDTLISVLDWDLPNPREWDDTVALPAVEDDE